MLNLKHAENYCLHAMSCLNLFVVASEFDTLVEIILCKLLE